MPAFSRPLRPEPELDKMSLPTDDAIIMAMEFTGIQDRSLIIQALKAKNNNVEAVMNEYFDSPEKFNSRYNWDESAFASNREGDEPSGTSSGPNFIIHPPDDNQILYGTDPGGSWGHPTAPSRPPSRANNRSPMSRMVEMTANEFTGTAPNNQHEEEALIQRAISESLNTSGVLSPQALPPPPPLPQQSGVTNNSGDNPVYFGPPTRSDYNPDEWAMVTVKRREADPEPSLRQRNPETPVFLRCRDENGWKQHRLGGILTILHSIPGARNSLLRTAHTPDYGYGNNPDWWKGEAILSPDRQAAKEAQQGDVWASDIYPPWSDELHRLVAFLDSTERSYGTADILADSRPPMDATQDKERDFFEELESDPSQAGTMFRTSVEIVSVTGDPSLNSTPSFALLDAGFPKATLAMAENLYSIWDMIFYTDSNDDPESARMAMITSPAEVITCRFTGDEWPNVIEIPETFYIDRYLAENQEQMKQLQYELSAVHVAFQKNREMEQKLTQWTNPETGNTWDRREMNRAGVKRCQEYIEKIRNRAFWREHEEKKARGEDTGFYLAPHAGEPKLLPDEVDVLAHYEAQIKRLEKKTEEIEWTITHRAVPQRKALERLSRHLSSLLTVPSEEQKWNATHKYTLRGVVSDQNTVFVRKRETPLIKLDENAVPPEQWWKLSVDADNDHIVRAEMVECEAAMREACGIGSKPILIFATDKAMEETPEPLSDALKTFIRFDNRHFKQELAQFKEQEKTSQPTLQSMSYLSTLRAAGVDVRRKRSDSMDSMATNQASMGDPDDEMRDAPFEQDEGFVDGDDIFDQDMPALVDISAVDGLKVEQPPPVVEMQEMQERGHSPLITRPMSGIFVAEREVTVGADDGKEKGY